MPRLQRATATRLPHRVELASPIVLEKPQLYTALGLGERSAWTWDIVNLSLLPFGLQSQRAAGLPPRALATHAVTPAGDADAAALIVSRAGVALSWGTGISDDIPLLKPGERTTIAYQLAWRDGARSFTGRDLTVSLAVGQRDRGDAQALQCRYERIKVAGAYRHTPEAAVLLIANHGTAAGEVDAWIAFLASLGLEANVLDLSHEGAVDLDVRFSPTQSLREEWRGRTVIALNNIFDSPNGRQSCADYLYDRQVIASIRDDGISWFVPGDGRPLFTAAGLIAIGRGSRVQERRAVTAPELISTVIPDETDLELTVTQTRRFGSPATAETLPRLAAAWAKRLAVDHPERRWLIVHRASPHRESGSWWKSHWQLGTLEVREQPGLGDAGMAAMPCPGERLHDVAYVHSPENQAALILALPFSEKLRLFTSLVVAAYNFDLVPERRALAEAYADAIVAELALEQETIRRSAGTWAAWSLSGMVVESGRIWCERWQQLCTSPFIAALPAGSERGGVLAMLIGRMQVLLRTFSPWWHVLLLGSRQPEITRQCQRLLRGMERAAFGSDKPLFTMPN
ncbi:MAG: hypothetical protein AAB263_17430, partial [Planctomycetota bacterium]